MKQIAALILLVFSARVFGANDPTTLRFDLRNVDAKPLEGHLDLGGQNFKGDSITFNSLYMLRNGRPLVPVMGEFHYVRYPQQYWDESLKKMRAGGITVVSTYVLWNIHEEIEGKFDWTGSRDLHHFVELCAKNGLDVIVRIGPFCHAEIRNGGLPDWLYGQPFNVRSNDPRYLHCVERLYQEIGKQLAGLLFNDGGPVIGIQLENEYQHSAAPWAFSYPGQPLEWTVADPNRDLVLEGVAAKRKNESLPEDGRKHMAALKTLARQAGLNVPLYTATGWGNAAIVADGSIPVTSAYPYPTWSPAAPSPLYLYTDLHSHPDYSPVSYQPQQFPSFAAELGGGIMVTYSRRPTITARSLEALIVRELGSGANAIGYYMYHGGSTPRGKQGFFSDEAVGVPKISYDFQAPIGQYGQLAESYGYLKLIHLFLNEFGSQLAPMVTVLPKGASKISPSDTNQVRAAVRSNGSGGFLFMHNFQDHVDTHDLVDLQIAIQTNTGEIRIPHASTMTLKDKAATFFPLDIDFGGVHVKYATAQPLTLLKTDGASRYVFVAAEGNQPEFALATNTVRDIESTDCEVSKDGNVTYVRCSANRIAEFVVEGVFGRRVTFAVFPKSLALHAWLLGTGDEKYLVFSDATLLPNGDKVEAHSRGNPVIAISVYPKLSTSPRCQNAKVENVSPLHRALSSHRLQLAEIDPFVHAKIADRRTLTLTSERATLPAGVNDVLVETDYTGDVGMAFLDGQLVDDHFYFGQPWLMGLKRFLPQLQGVGMNLSFRPLYKGGAFLSDLPPAVVPDFSKEQQVLRINHVRVIPEYCVDFRL